MADKRSQIGCRMPQWLIEEIDQWRADKRSEYHGILTRPQAVMVLVRHGLQSEKDWQERRATSAAAASKRAETLKRRKRVRARIDG